MQIEPRNPFKNIPLIFMGSLMVTTTTPDTTSPDVYTVLELSSRIQNSCNLPMMLLPDTDSNNTWRRLHRVSTITLKVANMITMRRPCRREIFLIY